MSETRPIPADVARAVRDAVAQVIENGGADAVLLCLTRHRQGETETYAVPFGNLHAVRGLAEYAYGRLIEGMETEDLEDEEEEEDDDDE